MKNVISNYALTFEAIATIRSQMADASKSGDSRKAYELLGTLVALYASIDAEKAAQVLGALAGDNVVEVDFSQNKKAA